MVRRQVDRSYQRMHREIPTRVGPSRHRRPGGPARQRAEALKSVLVAVLGVNALAGAKLDDAPGDMHLLARLADEMHLDATARGVVARPVAEACEVEVAVELSVDAREEIEVEPGSDAGGIVVGSMQQTRLLHKIDADNQARARPQHAPGMAQER